MAEKTYKVRLLAPHQFQRGQATIEAIRDPKTGQVHHPLVPTKGTTVVTNHDKGDVVELNQAEYDSFLSSRGRGDGWDFVDLSAGEGEESDASDGSEPTDTPPEEG